MKHPHSQNISFTLLLLALPLLAVAGTPQRKPLNKQRVIKQMTVEEKAHLLVGTGMKGVTGKVTVVGSTDLLVPGATGVSYGVPRLGVTNIVFSDGPAGLRISPTRKGDSKTYYCTHFPIGTLLASTWNELLVREVGHAIGNEVKEYGVDVLLAPGMNIMRNVLNGRNFEYYSEDPLLAGKVAAAYVRGVQDNGVGACIKHFAANNQETNRKNTDAHISQRALREIYLRPFEIAVKESKPWMVMTSYNHINGVYASESKDLIQTILRGEWGFNGTVVTDWFGGMDAAKQVWAGNDMLEPGMESQYQQIIDDVRDGRLAMADLNRNVGHVLDLISRTPRYNGYAYSNTPDLKAHAALTRECAAEGMVLLDNKQGTLPLQPDVKRIALYGCTSYDFIAGGTGSGNVNHAYVVSLTDGFRNAGYSLDKGLQTGYDQYLQEYKSTHVQKTTALNTQVTLPPEHVISYDALEKQARQNDLAVLTIGRQSGEFADRKSDDFVLSQREQYMLSAICRAYHAQGKRVVVILNVGGAIETASWKHMPDAILCAWQAGQEGGNSVVDVLTGKQSPSGKLTMSWPLCLYDQPSALNFPIDEKTVAALGPAKVDTVLAKVRNVGYTVYEEGVYVGYRYYDSFNVPVSYPFGYGLSYSSFAYSQPTARQTRNGFEVSVDITNTGHAEAKEVVQLYAAPHEAKAQDRPAKELVAFAKTRSLQPGETQHLTMSIPLRNFAMFDEPSSSWIVKPGPCDIMVGASVEDIKGKLKVTLPEYEQKVNDVLRPEE